LCTPTSISPACSTTAPFSAITPSVFLVLWLGSSSWSGYYPGSFFCGRPLRSKSIAKTMVSCLDQHSQHHARRERDSHGDRSPGTLLRTSHVHSWKEAWTESPTPLCREEGRLNIRFPRKNLAIERFSPDNRASIYVLTLCWLCILLLMTSWSQSSCITQNRTSTTPMYIYHSGSQVGLASIPAG
jgi:hypothetical protein